MLEFRVIVLFFLALSAKALSNQRRFVCIGQCKHEMDFINSTTNYFSTVDNFLRSPGMTSFMSVYLADEVANISTAWIIDQVQNVDITGSNTQVYCQGNNSGLVLRHVANINISGLAFLNCGSVQNSTSNNYRDAFGSTTLSLKTAIYFQYCSNIYLDSVLFVKQQRVWSGYLRFQRCQHLNELQLHRK